MSTDTGMSLTIASLQNKLTVQDRLITSQDRTIGNLRECIARQVITIHERQESWRKMRDRVTELEQTVKNRETALYEMEMKYRMVLWLSHGHTGLYGDDGEMQCSLCYTAARYGDYKRDPIQNLEAAVALAQQERLKKVMETHQP